MANENLMQWLPEGVKRASTDGPFKLQCVHADYPDGAHIIITIPPELVTCGGEDGRERADRIASRLNQTWKAVMEEEKNRGLDEMRERAKK